MKTLLISPPLRNMDLYQVRVRGCMPPLNLLYLAAYLKRHGQLADVLDLYAEPLGDAEFLERVRGFAPDVVGFATYTANVGVVLHLAAAVKARFPGIVVVAGGIHASFLPETVLRDPNVDYVVRGEGEETLLELVRALEARTHVGAIKGLARREAGEILSAPAREMFADLDRLPLPAYEDVDFGKYYLAVTRAVTFGRVASVLTMRGCPYPCSFCSHHFGYGVRTRKRGVSSVIEEVRLLHDVHGIRELQIEDSSFTCDPRRVIEICSEIVRLGLKLTWNCNARADTASDELFAAMKAAGCERVLLGAESGSQRMLDAMKKGITVEQIRRAVALARKHRMRITCAFVLGTPGETRETAEETYRLMMELDPDYVMFSVLVPSVGSELFDAAVAGGKVDPARAHGADFITLYSERDPIVQMSELTRDELVRCMEKYTRDFYLRPAYVARRLAALRSWAEVKMVFWGMVMIFRHQFRFVAKLGRR